MSVSDSELSSIVTTPSNSANSISLSAGRGVGYPGTTTTTTTTTSATSKSKDTSDTAAAKESGARRKHRSHKSSDTSMRRKLSEDGVVQRQSSDSVSTDSGLKRTPQDEQRNDTTNAASAVRLMSVYDALAEGTGDATFGAPPPLTTATCRQAASRILFGDAALTEPRPNIRRQKLVLMSCCLANMLSCVVILIVDVIADALRSKDDRSTGTDSPPPMGASYVSGSNSAASATTPCPGSSQMQVSSAAPGLVFNLIVLAIVVVPTLLGYLFTRFADKKFHPIVPSLLLNYYTILMVAVAVVYTNPLWVGMCSTLHVIYLVLATLSLLPKPALVIQYLISAVLLTTVLVEFRVPFGLRDAVRGVSWLQTGGAYNDAAALTALIMYMVVCPALFMQFVYNDVRVAVTTTHRHRATLSALRLFASHLQRYDTPSASAVLEDHEGYVDPELLRVLSEIVQNMNTYRPFIPQTLLLCPPTDGSPLSEGCGSQTQNHTAVSVVGSTSGGSAPVLLSPSSTASNSIDDAPLFVSAAKKRGLNPFASTAGNRSQEAATLVMEDVSDDDGTVSVTPVSRNDRKRNSSTTARVGTTTGRNLSTSNAPVSLSVCVDDTVLSPSALPSISPRGDTPRSAVGSEASLGTSLASVNPFAKSVGAAALVHFEDVHDAFSRHSEVTLSVQLSSAMSTLNRLCREFGATVQGMRGSSVMVTWGVDYQVKSLARTVAKFCIALRLAYLPTLEQQPRDAKEWMHAVSLPSRVSCAVHVGEMYYGAVGDASLKQLCILGPYTPTASGQGRGGGGATAPSPAQLMTDLELLFEAAKWHNAILVSSEIADQCTGAFHVRPIDCVRWGEAPPSRNLAAAGGGGDSAVSTHASPAVGVLDLTAAGSSTTGIGYRRERRRSNPCVRCFEVVAPTTVPTSEAASGATAEWMYSLQQAVSGASPFSVCEAMSQAMEKYLVGHYEEGNAVFELLSYQQRRDPRLVALEANAAAFRRTCGTSLASSATTKSAPATSTADSVDPPYVREFGWRRLHQD